MAATLVPEPTITATRYEVTCLPTTHPAYARARVTVEQRGVDSWAVMISGMAHDAHGEPSPDLRPSEITDEWRARWRMDLDTATATAQRLARVAAAILTNDAR
ncbi:hypothetical protein [Nocardia thailandica]|uniref:hypothetical protein n=1 Tax=Nocardia thailandica TaxID=257275 RepID=UPI000309D7F5|nr:hypothetical protein [Nocardia thailandica]